MSVPLGRGRSPKSAFAAAVLSLLFPGLGQAYLGAFGRGLALAAPPILAGALVGGLVLRADRLALLAFLVQPWVLASLLVLDVLLFVYRALAIVDAWRIAHLLAAGEPRRTPAGLPLPLPRPGPLSVVGLVAVLLVGAGGHLALARYDLLAQDVVGCIFDTTGTANCGNGGEPAPSAAPSPALGGTSPSSSTGTLPAAGPTLPPWNGTERLNILLIGTDQRPREGTYNTDTLIVVSIDPTLNQVAMFTLPRDTVDVPVPPGPAQAFWGTTYQGKINSWLTENRNRADLWPGTTDRTRGYVALKAILGYLYGIDIRWYAEVNFDGFRRVVDTVGGVTINVQIPVVDDRYPGDDGRLWRVYIPSGLQHMTGSEALVYARSRHTSSDFDRGQRQQRVLLSLKEQADPAAVLSRLDAFVAALTSAVHTDIPVEELPRLLSLAERIDTRSVRSYVFAPPLYEREVRSGDPRGYVVIPYVDRIRQAVRTAFVADPGAEARREALAAEGASLWVLDGTGNPGLAADVAAWLASQGLDASAPRQRPDQRGLATTLIRAYNGAETRFPQTAAFLTETFGVRLTPVSDPAARVDFALITGARTPDLTPPPAP
jgi:LCP family protein required for cell wall assembly